MMLQFINEMEKAMDYYNMKEAKEIDFIVMDLRNNNKTTKNYLEFTVKDKPNKVFTYKKKIDPSTCSMVIVYGGLV